MNMLKIEANDSGHGVEIEARISYKGARGNMLAAFYGVLKSLHDADADLLADAFEKLLVELDGGEDDD